ncbi:MAG: uroporphyrinogen-III synthase [Erythrobacter sp.]|nr:uroporphyrinogen-III synthase [Erythrobacter sp.]
MSRPLFVLRPEPGLHVTMETAEAYGLKVFGCPLFEVEAVGWDCPDPSGFDALLVGSSNVFRHGGHNLEKLERLPVYAVGEATAEGAREKGFIVSRVGKGGLQALLDTIKDREIRFLRLAGEKMVELDPPAGISIETRVTYRMRDMELAKDVAKAMRSEGGVVLLHSGEASRRLREECARLEIDRTKVTIAALGPRIADIAGGGWESVHVAPQALDAELLALAERLCQ